MTYSKLLQCILSVALILITTEFVFAEEDLKSEYGLSRTEINWHKANEENEDLGNLTKIDTPVLSIVTVLFRNLRNPDVNFYINSMIYFELSNSQGSNSTERMGYTGAFLGFRIDTHYRPVSIFIDGVYGMFDLFVCNKKIEKEANKSCIEVDSTVTDGGAAGFTFNFSENWFIEYRYMGFNRFLSDSDNGIETKDKDYFIEISQQKLVFTRYF